MTTTTEGTTTDANGNTTTINETATTTTAANGTVTENKVIDNVTTDSSGKTVATESGTVKSTTDASGSATKETNITATATDAAGNTSTTTTETTSQYDASKGTTTTTGTQTTTDASGKSSSETVNATSKGDTAGSATTPAEQAAADSSNGNSSASEGSGQNESGSGGSSGGGEAVVVPPTSGEVKATYTASKDVTTSTYELTIPTDIQVTTTDTVIIAGQTLTFSASGKLTDVVTATVGTGATFGDFDATVSEGKLILATTKEDAAAPTLTYTVAVHDTSTEATNTVPGTAATAYTYTYAIADENIAVGGYIAIGDAQGTAVTGTASKLSSMCATEQTIGDWKVSYADNTLKVVGSEPTAPEVTVVKDAGSVTQATSAAPQTSSDTQLQVGDSVTVSVKVGDAPAVAVLSDAEVTSAQTLAAFLASQEMSATGLTGYAAPVFTDNDNTLSVTKTEAGVDSNTMTVSVEANTTTEATAVTSTTQPGGDAVHNTYFLDLKAYADTPITKGDEVEINGDRIEYTDTAATTLDAYLTKLFGKNGTLVDEVYGSHATFGGGEKASYAANVLTLTTVDDEEYSPDHKPTFTLLDNDESLQTITVTEATPATGGKTPPVISIALDAWEDAMTVGSSTSDQLQIGGEVMFVGGSSLGSVLSGHQRSYALSGIELAKDTFYKIHYVEAKGDEPAKVEFIYDHGDNPLTEAPIVTFINDDGHVEQEFSDSKVEITEGTGDPGEHLQFTIFLTEGQLAIPWSSYTENEATIQPSLKIGDAEISGGKTEATTFGEYLSGGTLTAQGFSSITFDVTKGTLTFTASEQNSAYVSDWPELTMLTNATPEFTATYTGVLDVPSWTVSVENFVFTDYRGRIRLPGMDEDYELASPSPNATATNLAEWFDYYATVVSDTYFYSYKAGEGDAPGTLTITAKSADTTTVPSPVFTYVDYSKDFPDMQATYIEGSGKGQGTPGTLTYDFSKANFDADHTYKIGDTIVSTATGLDSSVTTVKVGDNTYSAAVNASAKTVTLTSESATAPAATCTVTGTTDIAVDSGTDVTGVAPETTATFTFKTTPQTGLDAQDTFTTAGSLVLGEETLATFTAAQLGDGKTIGDLLGMAITEGKLGAYDATYDSQAHTLTLTGNFTEALTLSYSAGRDATDYTSQSSTSNAVSAVYTYDFSSIASAHSDYKVSVGDVADIMSQNGKEVTINELAYTVKVDGATLTLTAKEPGVIANADAPATATVTYNDSGSVTDADGASTATSTEPAVLSFDFSSMNLTGKMPDGSQIKVGDLVLAKATGDTMTLADLLAQVDSADLTSSSDFDDAAWDPEAKAVLLSVNASSTTASTAFEAMSLTFGPAETETLDGKAMMSLLAFFNPADVDEAQDDDRADVVDLTGIGETYDMTDIGA